jgi:hypothetical protein
MPTYYFSSPFDEMIFDQLLLSFKDILNRLDKKDSNTTRDETNIKQEDEHTGNNPDINGYKNSEEQDGCEPNSARKSDSTSNTTSGSSPEVAVETVVDTVAQRVRTSKRKRRTPKKFKSPIIEKKHSRFTKKDLRKASKCPKGRSWSGNFSSYNYLVFTLTDSRSC